MRTLSILLVLLLSSAATASTASPDATSRSAPATNNAQAFPSLGFKLIDPKTQPPKGWAYDFGDINGIVFHNKIPEQHPSKSEKNRSSRNGGEYMSFPKGRKFIIATGILTSSDPRYHFSRFEIRQFIEIDLEISEFAMTYCDYKGRRTFTAFMNQEKRVIRGVFIKDGKIDVAQWNADDSFDCDAGGD